MKNIALFGLIIVFYGCSTRQEEMNTEVDRATAEKKVDALIKKYGLEFNGIKKGVPSRDQQLF